MLRIFRFRKNPRVTVIGCALLGQVAVLCILLWLMGLESQSPSFRTSNSDRTGPTQSTVLASGPIVSTAGDGWRLVDQFSAHHALILKIETENLWAAKSITQRLIEPIVSSYNEVLVYFYSTGDRPSLPARRVQWTKISGYVEMDLRE